jgi:hypothetical protein
MALTTTLQVARDFGIPNLLSERLRKQYIQRAWRNYADAHPGYKPTEREIQMTLRKKARTSQAMMFESYAIYFSNIGYANLGLKISDKDADKIATSMRIIAEAASHLDDSMDEGAVIKFVDKEDVRLSTFVDLLDEPSKLGPYVIGAPKFYDKRSKIHIFPEDAWRASIAFTDFFETELPKIPGGEEAIAIYREGRKKINIPEAESTLVEIWMKKKKYEKVRSYYSNGDYVKNATKLLDRLAPMGGEAAKINNILSWKPRRGLDRDEVGREQAEIFGCNTGLMQWIVDDVKNQKDDQKEGVANLLHVLVLEKYSVVNEQTVKSFLENYPTITTKIALPYINRAVKSLRTLKSWGYPIQFLDLGLSYACGKSLKAQRETGRDVGVRLDEEWYQVFRNRWG